ncbi:unnamed protein product [Rhizophagus irregularis]|nr:unnamed protein product [Rhizophagus irregularis]
MNIVFIVFNLFSLQIQFFSCEKIWEYLKNSDDNNIKKKHDSGLGVMINDVNKSTTFKRNLWNIKEET